jgi:AP-1-like transcription factor
MSRSDPEYPLSHNQQDLLVAALASNLPTSMQKASPGRVVNTQEKDNDISVKQNGYQSNTKDYSNQPAQNTFPVDQLLEADDSPYLGFDLDADGDDQYDFENNGQMLDDFAGDINDVNDLHEKRKSLDDEENDDEGGGKRREGEGGSKKPGRKPLTAEPTTVSFAFMSFSRTLSNRL